jgi:hypothetical protein
MNALSGVLAAATEPAAARHQHAGMQQSLARHSISLHLLSARSK